MKLSAHFCSSEFSCRCGCGFQLVDPELIAVLERIRLHAGNPISINSGCRCSAHNKKVGGKDKSLHLSGKAADIVIKNMSPREVFSLLNQLYPENYGIGSYKTFTHIDVRAEPARWAE